MYLDYYHLREYPFSLAADPRFLYFSPGHKEAMAGMLYCLRERKGVALLLGEPGTGKTTLLAAVSEMLPGGVQAQSLDTPLHSTPQEVLAAINAGFGLTMARQTLSTLHARLRSYLEERHARGECVLLVIDEAQDLNPLALEQVRLLTNLEVGGHKLLQIILSGQPELAAHLRSINGRALHQRIAVRCQLAPLSRVETGAYLAARLEHAGCAKTLFDEPAVERIHQWSQGVPRVINVIADHGLLAGFAAQSPVVTRALIERVAQQLELTPAAPAATAGAPAASGQRPAALQRFASGWARWAGIAAGNGK